MHRLREIFVASTLLLLSCGQAGQAESPLPPAEQKLESMLNRIDSPRSWQNVPVSGEPALSPPFARSTASAAALGQMLSSSTLWRSAAGQANPPQPSYPSQGLTNSAFVPQGWASGPNPFNLSPFGMLHYMWDDTTYVSASNPLTVTQTRSELMQSQHYAQLADSAAERARYAATAAEKREAAAQAQQYADLARQAAQQAQAYAEGGSANPSEIAALASQQAAQAQATAAKAAASAGGGW